MKLRADTLLIKLQFLLLSGIVMTQALGKPSLSSLLFTLTFAVTVCLWLVAAETRIGTADALAILIVALSCLHVSVNTLASGTLVSFAYCKKLIMFWSTVLFFAATSRYRPERSAAEFVFRWNTALGMFLIGMYLAQRHQMYLLNHRVSRYLTFRFTNPNLTAAFLLAVCMIEMIRVLTVRKRVLQVVHAVLAAWMAYFIFETGARNAQLLLALFLAVLVSPQKKMPMTAPMAALIAVFPLLFAAAYLLLVNTPGVQKVFAFLTGEGKNLDSRVGIWSYALEQFISSPLLGAYSQIVTSKTHTQLHNTHLDVMASYGLPVLILLCAFLYRVLREENPDIRNRKRKLCRMGFSVLLLTGMGEAMLFSGGLGVYIFAGVLRMLANYDFAG